MIGKDNEAFQGTSQSATNSITNANVAGRHLLGGEQKGCNVAPILLACASCVMASEQSTRDTLLQHTACIFQPVLCCSSPPARTHMLFSNLISYVAGWSDGFKKVTIQYLDANNKIVNKQVAVPSEWKPVCTALLLVVS